MKHARLIANNCAFKDYEWQYNNYFNGPAEKYERCSVSILLVYIILN